MAIIPSVALTNTFDTWRSRSNQSFLRLNAFAIDENNLFANNFTANVSFTSKGLATFQGRATIGTNLNVSGNTTIGAAGKTANVTGWFGVLGRASVSTNLFVAGNTSFGAAGKTQTSTGAWTHTGTKSISTNLTVSGNTSTNKATVTSLLTVSGNTVIGGAGKTANATGWFGVNGRQSISTNLFVGGNTQITGTGLGIGTAPITALTVQNVRSDTPGSGWLTYTASATAGRRGKRVNLNNDLCFDYYNGSSWAEHVRFAASGQVTAFNSMTVTQNLTVSGNTTLNGTTTDKSNALSQTLTDGATINWDTALGRVATVTLGATGRNFAAPTNLKVGTYILRVYQDATGGRTIGTWASAFKWTAAVPPVLSTAANALDIITFFSDGTNLYGSYLPDMR
jgi:hypothetical protein